MLRNLFKKKEYICRNCDNEWKASEKKTNVDCPKCGTRGSDPHSSYEYTCYSCGKKWTEFDGLTDGRMPKCPYCATYIQL